MTADTGLSKEEDEEEDDTMQNTVVLFSNTDKFVLQQVRIKLSLLFQLPIKFSVTSEHKIDLSLFFCVCVCYRTCV